MVENGTSNSFCKNAGLIICHPFLAQLFSGLGYLNNGKKFKDTGSTIRTVLLLHFLATGTTVETNEAELVLPKILCGIPINHPVQHRVALSEEEQQSAVGMLEAIITHWKSLENTGIDSLRETFLRRDAVLTKNVDGYRLVVERRAVDSLLAYMPWSISTVRLPWNFDYLRVEWE